MTDSPTSLEDALDLAAIAILARAQGSATVASDESGGAERISLSDQIKAFQAVAAYAEARAKAHPPATSAEQGPKESKFARIKHQFNGTDGHTPARRGRRAAAATDDPAGSA